MSVARETATPAPRRAANRAGWIAAGLVALCAALIAAPAPAGLPEAGKRVIAVAVLAIGLWCTEALPAGVTSLVLVVALVLSGAVPGFPEALSGFADPVAYFLIGVLTIGLAVSRSGLAERVARFFLRRSRGSARSLYLQLLLAFPLLTFILPSATTRTGILVHVYEQALELGAGAAPRAARAGDHDGAELHQPARLDRAADRRHHADGGGGADRRHLLEPVAAAHERAVPRAAHDRLGADLLAVPARIRRRSCRALPAARRGRCRARKSAPSRSRRARRRCG